MKAGREDNEGRRKKEGKKMEEFNIQFSQNLDIKF